MRRLLDGALIGESSIVAACAFVKSGMQVPPQSLVAGLPARVIRPLGADERIDIDRAGVRELERLPGVGPALAQRIVADRESRGAFGGIAALDRVSGIGPATLQRLGPHLTFSGRPADTGMGPRGSPRTSLNRAGVAELEALPGIGPVRAKAIVAFRDSAGPFRHVEDLRRVPGISSAVVDRLIDQLRAPP